MIQPKTNCPNCGREITKATLKKHYLACINPNSKLNLTKDLPIRDRNNLNCTFCKKLCKNLNSLAQHECRCKENPKRKDFNKFATYIRNESIDQYQSRISKQKASIKMKYDDGYVPATKGRKRIINHIYNANNVSEINRWLDYIDNHDFDIPTYELINTKHEGYKIISKMAYKVGNTVYMVYEHNFLANILINGKLTKDNAVHHIDKNPDNNDIHNFMIFETQGDHNRYHSSNRAFLIYNDDTHLFKCELR